MTAEGAYPKADGDIGYASEINNIYNLIDSAIQIAISVDDSNTCYRTILADTFTADVGTQTTICTADTTSAYDSTNDWYINYNCTDGVLADHCVTVNSPSATGAVVVTTCLTQSVNSNDSVSSICKSCANTCYNISCGTYDFDNHSYVHMEFVGCAYAKDTIDRFSRGIYALCVCPGLLSMTRTVCCCPCNSSATACLDFCRVSANTLDVYCNGTCTCQIADTDFCYVITTEGWAQCGCTGKGSVATSVCYRDGANKLIATEPNDLSLCPETIYLTYEGTVPANTCIRYDVIDDSNSCVVGCDLCPRVPQTITGSCACCIRLNIKQCTTEVHSVNCITKYGYNVQ